VAVGRFAVAVVCPVAAIGQIVKAWCAMSRDWAIFGFASGYVVGGLFGFWDNRRIKHLFQQQK
jgi:hypothetical protein